MLVQQRHFLRGELGAELGDVVVERCASQLAVRALRRDVIAFGGVEEIANLEGVRCGEIRPVPVKTVEQQTLQALHRIRTQ